jgi:hypothetical protein
MKRRKIAVILTNHFKKMFKKLIKNPWVITIIGGFVVYLLIAAFRAINEKIIFGKAILDLATKIYRVKIGDVILLILIAVIIISLINMNKKFRGLNPDKFKEMKAHLERMQRHNEALMNSANNVIAINKELRNQNDAIKKDVIDLKSEIGDKIKKELEQVLKKTEPELQKLKIAISKEHINILSCLASSQEDEVEKEILFGSYKDEFPQKDIKDFRIILNDLEEIELIRITSTMSDEVYYEITSKGLFILKEIQT